MSASPAHTNVPSLFGFSTDRGGAHLARTMMLSELSVLLEYVGQPVASKQEYRAAVVDANCLGKRSGRVRSLSFKYLADLYALDPAVTLFRALLYFWERDPPARPLLALLCAYARDPILYSSAPLVLSRGEGEAVTTADLEEELEAINPGRFSRSTLQSTVRNLRGTWTQSGHLAGKVDKRRTRPAVTPGCIGFALFLGYLQGARGDLLLRSDFMTLLDCPFDQAAELAETASRQGWIVFKRIGSVIEALFPRLLNEQEMELLREQG